MSLSCAPGRTFLLAGVLLYGTAISLAQTETAPGSSAPGQAIPGTLRVSRSLGQRDGNAGFQV